MLKHLKSHMSTDYEIPIIKLADWIEDWKIHQWNKIYRRI